MGSAFQRSPPERRRIDTMAPPTYGDLGKTARDVFGKGYHFSLMKLDVKTKTDTGVEFNSGGSSDMASGKIDGSLETKYKIKEHGLTLTEKWATDNKLATTLELDCQFFPGAKWTFDSTFAPQTGAKSGKIKTEFKKDMVSLNADMDLNMAGPLVNAAAVVGHQGWLAGYQMAFDTSKSALTKSNFALGHSTPTSMMERCSAARCIKKSTKILKLPSTWDGPPTRMRPTSALAASMHWRAMRGFVLRSTTDQKLDWDTNRSFVPALLCFYQP